MLDEAGFTGVTIGPAVDTFGGAEGERNARRFKTYGHAFLAIRD
jgi:arsenite methyltransferase